MLRIALARACALIVLLTACSPGPVSVNRVTMTVRSGSITDDYVEEPLDDRAKSFAHALEVSNTLLERIRSGDRSAVYRDGFSTEFHAVATEAAFLQALDEFDKGCGAIVRFKPMQWKFSTFPEGGKRWVKSSKIVECEKLTVEMSFSFIDDDVYAKPSGFHIVPRPTPAASKK